MSTKGFEKLWSKPSEPPVPTAVEKLTLERVRETVRRLGEEWPRRRRDLDAVQNWLSMTKGRMEQMSNRLDKLKNWVNLYSAASEATQESIRFQGWISVKAPSKTGENWGMLGQEIYIQLRSVKGSYEHCAMRFRKDTDSFMALEAEILHAIGSFKTEIDCIEASLSQMRQAREDDAKCREAFKQMQNNATNMADCSAQLCLRLYHAIDDLVSALGKPIKEL